MTKEELLALGLTEEQIAEVFRLKGIELNELKTKLESAESEKITLNTEKSNLDALLVKANEKLEEFKDVDPQKITEYETQIENMKNQFNNEKKSIQLDNEINLELLKSGAINVVAAKAIMDIESLKKSTDFSKDLRAEIDKILESDKYLFKVDNGDDSSKGGAGKGNPPESKSFDEMTYSERMEALSKKN